MRDLGAQGDALGVAAAFLQQSSRSPLRVRPRMRQGLFRCHAGGSGLLGRLEESRDTLAAVQRLRGRVLRRFGRLRDLHGGVSGAGRLFDQVLKTFFRLHIVTPKHLVHAIRKIDESPRRALLLALEEVLEVTVELRPEQLLEDLLTVGGVRREQLSESALRQHHDLPELRDQEPKQVLRSAP